MDWYSLSRQWFDWSFENPEKISPNHSALYFFAIEHCNRLWWRKKFWFPTEMAKDAIGIKSYHTYINTFNDLVEWGFIEVIERSKNQYSANIIALANFDKARDKALDKAIWKHLSKQQQSSWQSKSTIIKQIPTIEPENQETRELEIVVAQPNEYELSIKYLKENRDKVYTQELQIPEYVKDEWEWHKFVWWWTEISKTWKMKAESEKTFEIKRRFATWIGRKKETYQKDSKVAKVY